MKYIENLSLENLTKIITNYELGGGLVINGRIEVYSTKKVNDEKKQVKLIENKFDTVFNTTTNNNNVIIKMDCNDENEDNSTDNNNSTTVNNYNTNNNNSNNPVMKGVMSSSESSNSNNKNNNNNDASIKTKKVLGDLIQTMNCSMVDYDFSELSPDSFIQTTINTAIQDINSHIAEIILQLPNFINNLWRDISDVMMNLNQCEVYKLVDEAFIDEYENGMKWSFNYFFCSKEYKRVCYFTCIANSKYRKIDILGLNDDDDDDMDDDGDDHAMDTSDGVADGDDSEEDYYWD